MTSPITIDGPLARVDFDRFGLEEYQLFLRCKTLPESQVEYDREADHYTVTTPARFAGMLGVQDPVERRDRLPTADHLDDYQAWITNMALDARRFAIWADTGLGKTHMFGEWARQVVHLTNGRVLLLSPGAVIPQTGDLLADYFGLDPKRLDTRDALAAWCKGEGPAVGIATHHKLVDGVLPELRYLAGLVVDESSILKTGGGQIKWNLIKSAKGIEYKLSCTATPAPNDTMEYASQASFLEKLRSEGDILWTWFSRDKRGEWRVKPHARADFYRFMASWSIYMRNPKAFGFRDVLADLPAPDIREYRLEITAQQRALMQAFQVERGTGMFNDRIGVQERSKLSQLAKGFLYDKLPGGRRGVTSVDSVKPGFVAALVLKEVEAGRQVLVWTVFDEESRIIAEEFGRLEGVAVLDGSMSESARSRTLEAFRRGEVRVLISKASLIGYGLNFQHCRSMVFSGFDDSFERLYQAIRRCYRRGQTETVRVHIPYIPELEGMMCDNVQEKGRKFDADTAECEAWYRAALGVAA